YEAVANSPHGNTLLLEIAKRAVVAEQLGQDDTPDLLCLSLSSNDLVGHCWGPDSHEVLDVTLRTDRIIKELLDFLDTRVGKGRYALVLSADHGVCPTPEMARKQGKLGGRIDPKRFLLAADDFLEEKYGKTNLWSIEALTNHDFYLNRAWLKSQKLQAAEVEKALAGWVKELPMVQAVYTRTELLRGLPRDDKVGQKVLLSFH